MIRRRFLGLAYCLVAGGARSEATAIDFGDEPVRRDPSLPTMSLYVPISLGVPNIAAQTTGVFVPANLQGRKDG